MFGIKQKSMVIQLLTNTKMFHQQLKIGTKMLQMQLAIFTKEKISLFKQLNF